MMSVSVMAEDDVEPVTETTAVTTDEPTEVTTEPEPTTTEPENTSAGGTTPPSTAETPVSNSESTTTRPPGIIENTEPTVSTLEPPYTEPNYPDTPVNTWQHTEPTVVSTAITEDYDDTTTTEATTAAQTTELAVAGATDNGFPPIVLFAIIAVLLAGVSIAAPLIIRGIRLERIYRY